MSAKAMLIIMDGWGLGKIKTSDAIQNAHVPFTTSLYGKYPHTTLVTCGTQVGLPEGQMGNSEVGHLNLGAGRIVYQELERINVAIRSGNFNQNPLLLQTIDYALSNNKKLHLMGLVSDGGVHSHISHLKALVDLCTKNGLQNILIHAFTDGRDTDPKSGYAYLEDLQNYLHGKPANIATITGRYYAMDRDKRWERVQVAYNALVHAQGSLSHNLLQSVAESYAADITDEFLNPIINADLADTKIEAGDAVICFNFRTDRCREITEVLTQTAIPEYNMHPLQLYYTTMTRYDQTYQNVQVIYEKDDLKNTLGEVLEQHGKTQLRVAETEKYPHVTFFFSGGRELPFQGESRLMVPSPKVATYDLQPEMSAYEVTAKVVEEINNRKPDFICLNFANPDMVGHTGVWEAVIKAVETVDKCVEQVITTALEKDYTIFLLADHGNADYMINEDGTPNTAHTTNPVPLVVISNPPVGVVRQGKLGDLAPSILHRMGLPIPPEMTGDILID